MQGTITFSHSKKAVVGIPIVPFTSFTNLIEVVRDFSQDFDTVRIKKGTEPFMAASGKAASKEELIKYLYGMLKLQGDN